MTLALALEHIVFLLTISIVGSIGNLIVGFVYWKKRDKQTSTFFILFLAFIDLFVCSVLVPATVYVELIQYKTDSDLFCKSYYFLLTTSVPMSSLLMTAIAFDRYFCICMVNRNIMTLQRAKIVGPILLLISGSLGVIPAISTVIKPADSSSPSSSSGSSVSGSSSSSSLPINMSSTEYVAYDVMVGNTTISGGVGLPTGGSQLQCQIEPNTLLVLAFKICYDLVFVSCVVTITVLYVLIYKEIYTRRKAKRDRRRELLYSSYLNSGINFLNKDSPNQPPTDAHDRSVWQRVFFCFEYTRDTLNEDEILESPVKKKKKIKKSSKQLEMTHLGMTTVELNNNNNQVVDVVADASVKTRAGIIHNRRRATDDKTTADGQEPKEQLLKVRINEEHHHHHQEESATGGPVSDVVAVATTEAQPSPPPGESEEPMSPTKRNGSTATTKLSIASQTQTPRRFSNAMQSSILRRMSGAHSKHVISTKDIRTAFMLFVVSFLYIVFYLPSIATTYLVLLIPNLPLNLYTTYLYFSNSAINPIIYCFLNPNFRTELVKLFFKRGFAFRKCSKANNLR
jgi:hypothetical protein